MIQYPVESGQASGYFARPEQGIGPGVVVLHEWWGLTATIRQACDSLAAAGFMALAPDLYRGQTTDSVAEAEALGAALDQDEARWRGDIVGALDYVRANGAAGSMGLVAFSLGGSYALDMSIRLPDVIAAVVTVYAIYPGLDYHNAKAAYQCHFAAEDPFIPLDDVTGMEAALRDAGRPAMFYTYPDTKHWFFDDGRPEAFHPAAKALAWERAITFLNAELR